MKKQEDITHNQEKNRKQKLTQMNQMLKFVDKNSKLALVSIQDLKKNTILMSEEVENYRREIETIFLNGNCGTGVVSRTVQECRRNC